VSFDKIGHGEIKKASALSIAATVDKRPQKAGGLELLLLYSGTFFEKSHKNVFL